MTGTNPPTEDFQQFLAELPLADKPDIQYGIVLSTKNFLECFALCEMDATRVAENIDAQNYADAKVGALRVAGNIQKLRIFLTNLKEQAEQDEPDGD